MFRTSSNPLNLEALESRLLLAGAPAELLAIMPTTEEFIGYSFQDSEVLGDKLLFTGYRFGKNEQLWARSSSTNPTLLLTSISSTDSSGRFGINSLTNFNGQTYFFASSTEGAGLFVTDGTPGGTRAVKILRQSSNVLPIGTFILNNRLYFFWDENFQPTRLWSSDGTTDGTLPLWDAPPDTPIQSISPVIDGHVFFGGGGQLFRTDGTAEGTTLAYGGLQSNGYPDLFASTDEKMFFVQMGGDRRRLYVANRDGSGVTKIDIPNDNPDLVEAGVASPYLTAVGSRVLFISRDPQSNMDRLLSTDGTPGSMVQLAGGWWETRSDNVSTPVKLADGRAFFSWGSMVASRRGVWTTDGTLAGTQRAIPDLSLGHDYSASGWIFSNAHQSNIGYRVMRFDGTLANIGPIFYLGLGAVGAVNYVNTFQGRVIVQTSRVGGIPELWSLDPNVQTGSITGKAYRDINRNGNREDFEGHYAGDSNEVYIDIDGDNALNYQVDPRSSASDGKPYLFDGLPPGTYIIRHPDVRPMSKPVGGEYNIELEANDNVAGADFAFIEPNATVIWGKVFNDANKNGVRDPAELPAAGQDVYLDLNKNGLHDFGPEPVVQTRADGTYGFTVTIPAGPDGNRFILRMVDRPGWRQTVPAGRAGMPVTAIATQVVEAPPMGITEAVAGSIAGSVWTDWNRNGVRDSDDTQASGIQVYIDLNEDGVWSFPERRLTTSSNGLYLFPNIVPHNYLVRLTGFTSTQAQTVPAAGQGWRITVPEGGAVVVDDFLIQTTSAPPGGAISGFVWSDRDSDGVRDADEPGIFGRSVWIDLDGDNQLDFNERSATTNASGEYRFNHLRDATYALRQILPAGWTQTSPQGALGVTLSGGAELIGRNFGAHSDETVPPRAESGHYHVDSHTFRITFSEDVGGSLETGDLALDNPDIDAPTLISYEPATRTATFAPAAGLIDGNYIATLAAGLTSDLAGNELAEGLTFSFFILVGDLNRDRTVSIADFITLASNFGKTGATYVEGDINFDGQVSIADFIDLSAKFNFMLAEPAQQPMAAAGEGAFEPVSADVLDAERSQRKGSTRGAKKHARPILRRHHPRRLKFWTRCGV
jgi:hypothetical protein